MPTKLMQRNEASMTTFKDDALEVAVILHTTNRVFIPFQKFEIMNEYITHFV